jgi:hypothetical protein
MSSESLALSEVEWVETSLDCLKQREISTPLRFGRNDKWRFCKTALLLNPVKRECLFRKS